MYDVYKVKFGDTLEDIAINYGITKDELLLLNGNKDIQYGSLIVVPSVSNAFLDYTIQNGDTIYSIALKYNISPDILLNLNGLNKDEYIYPGETIKIPKNDIGIYLVKENDTLTDILKLSNYDDILAKNKQLYLLPGQILIYTKE